MVTLGFTVSRLRRDSRSAATSTSSAALTRLRVHVTVTKGLWSEGCGAICVARPAARPRRADAPASKYRVMVTLGFIVKRLRRNSRSAASGSSSAAPSASKYRVMVTLGLLVKRFRAICAARPAAPPRRADAPASKCRVMATLGFAVSRLRRDSRRAVSSTSPAALTRLPAKA